MASSSSSPSTSTWTYDVFINHHGLDVKKNFASHLYHRLSSYGLKVFLDQEELQRGDSIISQIKGAIEKAFVHVAIFSVRYAESTWCLNELLWMSESSGIIIPVFYYVEPAELRWTWGKGVYAQALHKLEGKTTDAAENHGEKSPQGSTTIKNWGNTLSIEHLRNALKKMYDPQAHGKALRHNPTTVQQWRNALHKVSLISGFELKACNGDEGILLNNVVESVLKIVKKPLDVAKYPTGLNEKFTEFENKVLLPHQQSPTKSPFVGIFGLGGAGKTTLAKELFNQKRSQYSKYNCFLHDVRENVDKGSLISLQSELLKMLTGTALQIHNKDEGIEMLKRHLSSKQILLILDDVGKVDHVDALVPNPTSVHPNSLILITSRDKDVLTRSGVEKSLIYKLNRLNNQHSLELFFWHAFRQSYPLPEFEDLTEKFVNACNGLPLSLKVFGALLYGNNDKYYWEKQLHKLGRILPSEIQERLRISYDALDVEEKQIFLDIACFFIGENKDTAIRIWNDLGWGGELGFQTLQNKCLVEVVEGDWGNEISMHDHLRDLGRLEARVSQPLRVCHFDDLLQQSHNGQVITVRGIRVVPSEYHDDDDFDCIQMWRLALLDTQGILLERILERVKCPHLIWLCWKECPYSSLPSSIPVKNLRVFRASGSRLETLWQQESQAPLQLPVHLEELRVNGCQQLKYIYGLPQLTNLHRLDVSGCIQLEELPSMETLVSLERLWAEGCVKLKRIRGLEQATKLKRLGVGGCIELEELPSMETLVSLERLWAEGCVKLKRIRGLEQATKLKMLGVGGCIELEELPNMETLVSLEHLWANGCVKVKSIRGLEQATKLRLLNVDGFTELEELPNMKTLVSLEYLSAKGCVKVKSIRGVEQATKLDWLNVDGCTELEELPNMELLVSLKNLRVKDCVKLKSILGLEHAIKLKWFSVNRCTELEELPNMETLVCLETLWVDDCVKLKSIRGLEHAIKLHWFSVYGCSELEELPNMERLVSLEELHVERCVKLKSIRGLEQCTMLRILEVGRCTELEELPNLETLVCLETLWIDDCVKLKSIRGLEHAIKLHWFSVYGCSELEELPNMERLVSLEELHVERCVKLKSIRGLEQCTMLRILEVGRCTELEELPNLETLVCLETLWIDDCVKLKSIRGLEHAIKLHWFSVNRCTELEELPNMERLVSLEELHVERCVKLKSIRGLEQCTMLRILKVGQCTELEELPNLETLVSLEQLWAEGCVKLKSIRGLEKCTMLTFLLIAACLELEELPSMETLVSLKEFYAAGCVKLKSIRGLLQCTQLEVLDVFGCRELEEVEGVEDCTWLKKLDVSRCPKLQCPVWESKPKEAAVIRPFEEQLG